MSRVNSGVPLALGEGQHQRHLPTDPGRDDANTRANVQNQLRAPRHPGAGLSVFTPRRKYMDAVLAPPDEDTDLSEFEDITPACELVKIQQRASLLQLLFESLNGALEEDCEQPAEWILSFQCAQAGHGLHRYLSCEDHHQLLAHAVVSGKPTQWVRL